MSAAADAPATPLAQECTRWLAAGGPLAQRWDGFSARPAQQQLAAAMADTLAGREVLLAEAGTGTGKTFAYLLPLLLSGTRAIISTATRALQDQLYHRDLPHLRRALGAGGSSALLKGRSNYLCRYRLALAQGQPRFAGRTQAAQFHRIIAWAAHTESGDLAELTSLPEDSPLLPRVTSSVDNCLGRECPLWDGCFVVKARAAAQKADIVVVNHHLLLADLALKQDGFGDILPGVQAFVIDEAHRFPELAGQFFGERLSARVLVELARDVLDEAANIPAAQAVVEAPARALEQAVRDLRECMAHLPPRGTGRDALADPACADGVQGVADALRTLDAALAALEDTSPGLGACRARGGVSLARLGRWQQREPASTAEHDADDGGHPEADSDVYWYELSPRGFALNTTPLDVSGPLRTHRERSRAAWIFTSATLAVAGRFEHLARSLGLDAPQTLIVPSPFDWPQQALCYLPPGLPDPAAADYTRHLLDAVWPVLEASGGRAFVLFSSWRTLHEAARRLRERACPWPLFVQGEAARGELLRAFRASGNGVLLGAASFREGVDVAGDALSVVIIDKLPFAAPDDPVFQAQLEAVQRGGGNPFRDVQLPQAVIALKQGAGRLIRSERDHGVLVLCDPRLTRRSYGKTFINSLPPLPMVYHPEDVTAFFQTIKNNRHQHKNDTSGDTQPGG